MFHHGRMAALIYEMQFGVFQQPVELVGYHGRGNGIVQAPNQQRWFIYGSNIFGHVVALRRFGNGNNAQTLGIAVGNIENLVYEFFGGYFRVVEGVRGAFFHVGIIAAFRKGTAHRIFEQPELPVSTNLFTLSGFRKV